MSTKITELAATYRNAVPLFALGSRLDPYPIYRRLRALGPTRLAPLGMWLITGYDDANRLLRSDDLSSANHNPLFEHFFRGQVEQIRQTILFSDPPDHTRLRTLVSRAFTPSAPWGNSLDR